jgi:hypothetical protein
MTLDEVKSGVLSLSEVDQKKLITEVIPLIWPTACLDDVCVAKFRELVDEATIKDYREQHLGSI